MDGTALVLEKLAFILLLIGAGILIKGRRLLSNQGEADLGTLQNTVFWPAMTFYSICGKLDPLDIGPNLLLTLLSVYMIVVGLGLGWLFVRWRRYQGDEKKIFLFLSSFNNSAAMALPLVAAFVPDKGPGMLFIANLGFILLIWTLGVALLKGKVAWGDMARHLFSPVLISTLVAILVVLLGWQKAIPTLVYDTTYALGYPMVAVGLVLVGTRVFTMGKQAFRPNGWNLQLSLVRLVLVPLVMLATALVGRAWLGWNHDMILVFLILSVMPASVSSVPMALSFRSSPDLAAQSILMTHVFSVVTITGFLVLFQFLLPT